MDLPELTHFHATALSVDGDYDGLELRGLELIDQDAADARFVECGLFDCRLDGSELRGAFVLESVWDHVHATSIDVARSSWRDAVVRDCRFGALDAHGATMTGVRFAGGKFDFVNLRGSELSDVLFVGCRLGEVDLGAARLKRVSFVDCRIDKLEFSGAALDEVDISRSELQHIGGIANLAGALISDTQLQDLSVVFARHLGVQVVELS